MANVEEVKLHVAAAVEQADSAAQAVALVLDRLDQSLARLQLVTVGSMHPSAAQALLRLAEARIKLIEAQTLLRSGSTAASEYVALI